MLKGWRFVKDRANELDAMANDALEEAGAAIQVNVNGPCQASVHSPDVAMLCWTDQSTAVTEAQMGALGRNCMLLQQS